jgi:hypothetical protein
VSVEIASFEKIIVLADRRDSMLVHDNDLVGFSECADSLSQNYDCRVLSGELLKSVE